MAISEVIQFEGPINSLVWKHPCENFTLTSQLIVDETHEAILVMNGNAVDTFPPGRRTLETANIPGAGAFIKKQTDGKTPFPCKVFFINKVQQMDMLWGTQGPITLDDPLYDIFLHVGVCGSMTLAVKESRKFLLKSVGLRDVFDPKDLIANFRGIISTHVKNCVSKIMINGMVSFFVMNAHLFELGEVVKEKLSEIFDDYGVEIVIFNIESITVPDNDYKAITSAKETRSKRLIEGYTWQEERQMAIMEKFAGNEGAMGSVTGAVGGFMMGGAFGGTISELARQALSEEAIPNEKPPKDLADKERSMGGMKQPQGFNVKEFFEGPTAKEAAPPEEANAPGCPNCKAKITADMAFCSKCGHKLVRICPDCGAQLADDAGFCHKCGKKLT